jgi:hypothetical protein
VFLSKAERDYLSGNLAAVSDGYNRVMRSRLHKKVQLFISQELPLLVEKGYVTEFRNSNVTENCNNNYSTRVGVGTSTASQAGPKGFGPLICGSEDRRDILTTLRAQAS